MKAIDVAVTAKLGAQRGQEEALALWREIWAAFEAGGPEQAEACVETLLNVADTADEEGSR